MSGIFILLIIAVAAGAGVGVTVAKTKNNNKGSSTPTDSSSTSPTSSGGHAPPVTVTASISSSHTPTPTPIRRNSPLAAVNFNTSNIQLLYKRTDGSIRLLESNGLEGTVKQVRVYTAGLGGALIKSGWNSSHGVGESQDISNGTDIAPLGRGSHLTGYTRLANGLRQSRVYYQGQDGYIREAAHNSTNDGDWWKGAAPTIQDFPRARNGTGLAIVSFPDTDEREANYITRIWTGSWCLMITNRQLPSLKVGRIKIVVTLDHGSITDGTQVTAASCILATGELALRIYFIRDGKLVEIWWTRKAEWNAWYMHDAVALGVSAVSSTDDVNVFFQTNTGYFSDMSLNRYPVAIHCDSIELVGQVALAYCKNLNN
ncbi:hypothetical protein B9Z19DRAFT_1135127 [Tuber borchii]|uniref:Fucose-specific lectin n=1 Tax=Tuber borchii TaxID=42251 RepID=A0A2T6ZD88_TUBBO|nr:hypothetical protein B9Z19DRAFT_1135127 [Tuber borchii]